ncbi:hypothetical protein BBD46_06335 [Natrialba sp. SSL1]|nr:hypothetical protein BBD46_06335 [Natrialba sp. SSL1]
MSRVPTSSNFGRRVDFSPGQNDCSKTDIIYKYAEGVTAGELKHGPLALVTEEILVFALITQER